MKMLPILSTVEKGAQDGLRKGARAVLKLAREVAPEDDGTLRKSGRVIVEDLTAEVKFTAPHAWLQHERVDWEHDKGQAKFLEFALDAVEISPFVREGVKAVIING